MTSRYFNIGGGGPWLVDDDAIVGDGYMVGLHVAGGPTVDGLDFVRNRHHGRGGLVNGKDEHLVHNREDGRPR